MFTFLSISLWYSYKKLNLLQNGVFKMIKIFTTAKFRTWFFFSEQNFIDITGDQMSYKHQILAYDLTVYLWSCQIYDFDMKIISNLQYLMLTRSLLLWQKDLKSLSWWLPHWIYLIIFSTWELCFHPCTFVLPLCFIMSTFEILIVPL